MNCFLPPTADPAVPRTTLEGVGLTAGKADPETAPRDNVAQTAADKAPKTKVMVLVNRRIPATILLRKRQAHRDLRKRALYQATGGACKTLRNRSH